MFVAEAIADFSATVIQPQKQDANSQRQQEDNSPEKETLNKVSKIETIKGQDPQQDDQEQQQDQNKNKEQEKQEDQQGEQAQQQSEKNEQQKEQSQQQLEEEDQQAQTNPKKRKRDADHQQQFADEENKPSYIQFKKGQKILVRQTDQSGWWFGNVIGKTHQGFFPSTFVQCGSKAPLPPAPPEPKTKDWMAQQLQKMHQGPVQSEYYQGIIGHKLVKIDEKNKNLLKANYVKFNEATGLASVPIKSQAPNAKAVRQMGYYFDYHQWIDSRNKAPEVKARPDIRRKKPKKLNLKLFGEEQKEKKKK